MANVRLNLVVAACANQGIGINGQLPWRLKKDMEFFKKITTETKDPDKRNAVIMGRITYFSIPEKFRPLAKRFNIIMSRELKEAPANTHLVRSLDDAVSLVSGTGELADKVENVYVIGGGLVYKEAMTSNYSCRVYITRVLADIKCDTFFPELDENSFRKVDDCDDVPSGQFTENGLDFKFEVYDKREIFINVCVAMCNNRGIGLNRRLPWPPIREDYEYYIKLTTTTTKKGNKCARIQGRHSWMGAGHAEKSHPNYLNIIVSKNNPDSLRDDPYVHKIVHTFEEAVEFVLKSPTKEVIEKIWVMGGQMMYQEAFVHPLCKRVYLTRVYGDFESDTYCPEFEEYYKEIRDPCVDDSMKEENGIQYQFKVYERTNS